MILMKKMFVFLGLVVMMMFVVSCAPGNFAGQATKSQQAECKANKDCNELFKACDTKNLCTRDYFLCSKACDTENQVKKCKAVCSRTITACLNSCYDKAIAQQKGEATLIEEKEIHSIELKPMTDKRYNLFWRDGDGMIVSMPLVYLDSSFLIQLGDGVKSLILKEELPIEKGDYFVISKEGKSYLLQYKGADKSSVTSPKIRFKNVGDGTTLDFSQNANINYGGSSFGFKAASDTTQADYSLFVDLNGDGVYNADKQVVIYDHGYAILVNQLDLTHVRINVNGGEATGFETGIESKDNSFNAFFLSGCDLVASELGKMSCSFSPKENLAWYDSLGLNLPGQEKFVFSYTK